MAYEIVRQFPKDMIFKEVGPLISLYQPTHRSSPDNKQDPIVFKNLLRVIEKSLEQLPNDDAVHSIMKSLHEIKEDEDFWMHTLDGIAVFASSNKCIVYNLQIPVKEYAVVADRFHITPLIKAFQSVEEYQLLGLSRENFSLYQGNRYGFEEMKIHPDTPRTMKEVLGSELSGPYLSHGSYGGAGSPTMYHGHGDVKQEIDKDTEKYFRYVDSFVFEKYSKKTKRPLILVALKEYHSEFRKISNNPYLLEKGIHKSIESFDKDELLEKARSLIEAINKEKLQKVVESFAGAEAESLGSSDLARVIKAASEGRVETILIEEDIVLPGKIDFETGKVRVGDNDDPEFDDILDDLAELVISNGGDVFVLDKDEMPGDTGVAAIFRYS
ncbi:MAG: hypothetical protein JW817_07690 [Clostridiales bacterium]|nr:hypothetical protein [Clostridiales bacterium]